MWPLYELITSWFNITISATPLPMVSPLPRYPMRASPSVFITFIPVPFPHRAKWQIGCWEEPLSIIKEEMARGGVGWDKNVLCCPASVPEWFITQTDACRSLWESCDHISPPTSPPYPPLAVFTHPLANSFSATRLLFICGGAWGKRRL